MRKDKIHKAKFFIFKLTLTLGGRGTFVISPAHSLSWSICTSGHTQWAFIIHQLRGPWCVGATRRSECGAQEGGAGGERWRLQLRSPLFPHPGFLGCVWTQSQPHTGCWGAARGEDGSVQDIFPLEAALGLGQETCVWVFFSIIKWNNTTKQKPGKQKEKIPATLSI